MAAADCIDKPVVGATLQYSDLILKLAGRLPLIA